jgi:hypothetical protein
LHDNDISQSIISGIAARLENWDMQAGAAACMSRAA